MTIRTALLCLLLCLAPGGCTSRAARCDGPLEPINAPVPDQPPSRGASAGHDDGAP